MTIENQTNRYIYHRIVENMKGEELYPLNTLKTLYPSVYQEHVQKYIGREHLLTTEIPILNCLWNDVLHFTAVHPKILFEALEKVGYKAHELVWKRWFEIPIEKMDQKNTIVCTYRRDISLIPDSRDFQLFDSSKLTEYSRLPPETLEYYKEQRRQEKRPLFFHRVPHILYKGSINISGCSIIEV